MQRSDEDFRSRLDLEQRSAALIFMNTLLDALLHQRVFEHFAFEPGYVVIRDAFQRFVMYKDKRRVLSRLFQGARGGFFSRIGAPSAARAAAAAARIFLLGFHGLALSHDLGLRLLNLACGGSLFR